ncbi:mediator of RNA polymerase II transcription subunit 1-like [Mantella aurantiaca]
MWSPTENDATGLPAPIEHQQERKIADMAPLALSRKALLEKLHSKYSQKQWTETFKLVRYCMEKPAGNALKSSTDHPVLTCRNTLQEAIKAKSLSTLLTRIEAISKQKGLESHLGPNGRICYITSEMFYIEVQVKRNGHVGSVKLAHHGESPTVCKELLFLLRAKDFEGFGRSLEGLLHLYNIPGDSEIKAKVYLALCSLETDLIAIYNLSRPTTDEDRVAAILHGKVGYLSPRCGGTPMNIEYYISPYQVLEEKLKPGTRVIGNNASVTVVGTNNWYNLPVSPSFQEVSQESDSSYEFSTVTEVSSMVLPACFFLTFEQPEPILLHLIQKIQNITGIPVVATDHAPLHELLIDLKLKQPGVHREIQFTVSLPGSMDHCYVLNSRCENESAVGALVNKIPFTQRSHVPFILEILRYQAAYSTLLNSCLSRTINPKDHNGMLHFEVSLQKDSKISISFPNPSGGSLSCVVVEVLSSRKLMCTLYTSSSDPPLHCNSEFIVRILECCMSIPITMRTIIKKAHKEEVAETMETSCIKNGRNGGVSSENSGEIHSEDLSDPLWNEEKEKPPSHGKNGSVCVPNEEMFPEKNGGISSCGPNEELFPDTNGGISSCSPNEELLLDTNGGISSCSPNEELLLDTNGGISSCGPNKELLPEANGGISSCGPNKELLPEENGGISSCGPNEELLPDTNGGIRSCGPNEELLPDTNSAISSVDSHECSPCPVQETNSSSTEEIDYHMTEVNSSIEEPNSSLAEGSCSSLVEDPNSSIQELSPIMTVAPSPDIADVSSSSIAGELSSSITEELSRSVSGFAMP